MGSSEEEDTTLLGDLGCSSSSGCVGSSDMSSSVPSTNTMSSSAPNNNTFQLNSPCANFPMSVSCDSYHSGPGSMPPAQDPDLPDEDEFSEDSLLESESPRKRKRVTKSLVDVAQHLACEDSLANLDSLVAATPGLGEDSLTVAVDSLDPGSLGGGPAGAGSHASVREQLARKISDINAQIKQVEARQLLAELASLEREVLSVSLTPSPGPSPGARPRWTVTNIEIACEDLSGNSVQSYSEAGSVTTLDTASTVSGPSDLELELDPPVPRKATLPAPVPNLAKLQARKSGGCSAPAGTRPLVEHSGAVGVTSMWIPAADSPRPVTGKPPLAVRPKIQSKSKMTSGSGSNKAVQRTSSRDQKAAIGKKLQIETILPNKTRAEGSHGMLQELLLPSCLGSHSARLELLDVVIDSALNTSNRCSSCDATIINL